MMEHILSRDNVTTALKRVEANKGSHGVDGMSVQTLREHLKQHWRTMRAQIEQGTYEPSPVRRVEIPKPNGGTRGIPTVTDRFIQQAMVLSQVCEPLFSEHSYEGLDGWMRRRLRMCMWKQWKNPRTKVKRLQSLGIPKGKAYEWGNARKGYWRIAGSPILSRALNNKHWKESGLQSLLERYKNMR